MRLHRAERRLRDGYSRLSRGAERPVTCGWAAVPNGPWTADVYTTSIETAEQAAWWWERDGGARGRYLLHQSCHGHVVNFGSSLANDRGGFVAPAKMLEGSRGRDSNEGRCRPLAHQNGYKTVLSARSVVPTRRRARDGDVRRGGRARRASETFICRGN